MLSVQSLVQEAKVSLNREARLGRREERRMMAEALDDLPEIARLILGLRYYESVRPAQIAVALGLPEEEVRHVLAEALRQILESSRRRRKGTATEAPPRAARRNGNGRGRGE